MKSLLSAVVLASTLLSTSAISYAAPINAMIMGGDPVAPNDPIATTTVAIYGQTSPTAGYLCTGSIVAEDLILTAAHCLAAPIPKLRIIFGINVKGATKVVPVTAALRNPQYRPNANGTNWNDIALFKFEGGLPPGYQIVHVLQDQSLLGDGVSTILAGYGITQPADNPALGDQGAGVLRKVETTIINAHLGTPGSEVEVSAADGRGSCHGDSGGPAYVAYQGTLYLYGVTSHTVNPRGTCEMGSIYTNVVDQMPFLQAAEKRLDPNGGN